jgi:hydrogenase maturation protein HypF
MNGDPPKRVRVTVGGVVQGVGFRPFVYRVARRLALTGFAHNSASGFVAEVEGDRGAVEQFVAALAAEAPPLARVGNVEVAEVPLTNEGAFVLRESVDTAGEFALVSPDIATCEKCRGEILDASNRRHGYAFTNCTDCGPRYTIVEAVPYDRPNTTMRVFAMCPECRAEYGDPANRRFHAQPNACPVCGPSLSMTIAEAQRRLSAGEIVAVKGLGGFHLACDARDAEAVERLRLRKKRSDKPFAVMCRNLASAERICAVAEADRVALEGPERPIVILAQRGSEFAHCAPGNRTLGVMLPYTPLHHLLFNGATFDALVMTSGNLSEEPIVTANAEARSRLGGVADAFLTHDRDIHMRADDSVVRTFGGVPRVLRRSRGFAPRTIDLGRALPEGLACGADLKNTFCLTKGSHAILSPHIGDLENYETQRFYQETLWNLQKVFRVLPRVVAHDLHPLYASTRLALSMERVERVPVQHHHAHIAGCMAENGLDGEVIGVAFDGTGYGTDGRIWGGEFLVARYDGFERYDHIRYFPLAGGDSAVREPWRSAMAFGQLPAGVSEAKARVVRQMIGTRFNCVETSSCGRLFDAAAAVIGLRNEITYEAQAAIELEMVADPAEEGVYPRDGLDFRPAMDALAADGVSVAVRAARFHNTVADAVGETCGRIRRDTGLRRVCLSGGVFQNVLLLTRVMRELREFDVFLHAAVPANDGGIALGQAVVMAAVTALR